MRSSIPLAGWEAFATERHCLFNFKQSGERYKAGGRKVRMRKSLERLRVRVMERGTIAIVSDEEAKRECERGNIRTARFGFTSGSLTACYP